MTSPISAIHLNTPASPEKDFDMSQYTPEQTDLRHLIYASVQFDHRGATDLKAPELAALVARGWMHELDGGDFEITDTGNELLSAVLDFK